MELGESCVQKSVSIQLVLLRINVVGRWFLTAKVNLDENISPSAHEARLTFYPSQLYELFSSPKA